MSILNITNENFKQEVLEASGPVLVDFWAPWCGYCRRLAPALDKIAAEHAGALTVAKINIDDAPALAEQFSVSTIPTLLVFKNGKAGNPIIAPESKAMVEEWLKAEGAL